MFHQRLIIERMRALGYEANRDGVCFGITHMEIQAILVGQRKEFEARLRFIAENPDLTKKITAAQNRVKKKEDPMEGDQELLEVLSFFDGIILYQNRTQASEWFSANITESTPLKVASFVQSSALEKEGGIAEVHSGIGFYTEEELTAYLEELANILSTVEDSEKIAIKIGSYRHAMLLTYDSKNKLCNLFDPNQLLKEPVSTKAISGEIMRAFDETPHVGFATKVYTTKKYADKSQIKDLLKPLHNILAHTIDKNKATMKIKKDSITLLHLAARGCHIDVVKALLENGAAVSAQDAVGNTALHQAADSGHVEVVEALLKNGAKVDSRNTDGETALHLAALHGHIDVVKALLDQGAAVDSQSKFGHSALGIAAENGHLGVVNALLEKGAKVDSKNANGRTALHLAAESGHVDVVEAFLKKGAVVDSQDDYRRTPLHLAAERGHIGAVKALLTSGAAVNAQAVAGETALHVAAQKGRVDVVKILLKEGAKVDSISTHGNTALHLAAANGHPEVINFLLENGAAVDYKNHRGETALHLAAESGHVDVVNALLEKGAKVDSKNANGRTALYLADWNFHVDVVKALKSAAAKTLPNKGAQPGPLTFGGAMPEKGKQEDEGVSQPPPRRLDELTPRNR